MPTIKINVTGGQPLFDIASYARGGSGRRDRFSPAELALISRTVHRAPEVMVKVFSKGSTTLAAVAKHVNYIDRNIALGVPPRRCWLIDMRFCSGATFHRAPRGKRMAAAWVSPPDEAEWPLRRYTETLANKPVARFFRAVSACAEH